MRSGGERRVQGRGMVPGGVWVGGYQGWLYRVLPSCSGRVQIQRSGPRKPCKGWSGWYLEPGAGRSVPTLRARSVPCRALPGTDLAERPSLAYRARIDLISWKLSQNGIVSPKCVEKACHSPHIQKRVQKSPLDISQISTFASLLSQGINGLF